MYWWMFCNVWINLEECMNAKLGEVLQKERETTHKSTKNYVRALAVFALVYNDCVLDAE